MADPVTALTVVALGSTVAKGFEQDQAANEKDAALDLQAKENILSYQQKSLSNLDVTKQILDKQTAESTVRGINASMSPSFNAIQRNTVNIGAKEGRNLDTEQSIMEQNTDIEKQNVKDTLYAQLFGDVSDVGLSFAKLKGSAPSLPAS